MFSVYILYRCYNFIRSSIIADGDSTNKASCERTSLRRGQYWASFLKKILQIKHEIEKSRLSEVMVREGRG